jgi:hypothetical protein
LNKPRRGALVGDPNFFGETPKRPGRRYVSSPRARPSLRGSDHDGARQIRNAPNLYGPGRVIDGRVDPSAKRGWPKPSFNSFAHPHSSRPATAVTCGCAWTSRIGTRRLMVCSQSSPCSPAPRPIRVVNEPAGPGGCALGERKRLGTRPGLRSSCVSPEPCLRPLIESSATSRNGKCFADRDTIIAKGNSAGSLLPMLSLRWARTPQRVDLPSR